MGDSAMGSLSPLSPEVGRDAVDATGRGSVAHRPQLHPNTFKKSPQWQSSGHLTGYRSQSHGPPQFESEGSVPSVSQPPVGPHPCEVSPNAITGQALGGNDAMMNAANAESDTETYSVLKDSDGEQGSPRGSSYYGRKKNQRDLDSDDETL
uniref:Uncharacterized protein n=1 Tax=Eutreptiella gymnastica TaxID=73025 RepID=A0A7S4CT08_9EUGL